MFTYIVVKNEANEIMGLCRSDGAFVPAVEGNSDYQAYLGWSAEL